MEMGIRVETKKRYYVPPGFKIQIKKHLLRGYRFRVLKELPNGCEIVAEAHHFIYHRSDAIQQAIMAAWHLHKTVNDDDWEDIKIEEGEE